MGGSGISESLDYGSIVVSPSSSDLTSCVHTLAFYSVMGWHVVTL